MNLKNTCLLCFSPPTHRSSRSGVPSHIPRMPQHSLVLMWVCFYFSLCMIFKWSLVVQGCDFISWEWCGHGHETWDCVINQPQFEETMTRVIYRVSQHRFPYSSSLIHSYPSEGWEVKESTVWVVASLPRSPQQSHCPYRKADIYALQ